MQLKVLLTGLSSRYLLAPDVHGRGVNVFPGNLVCSQYSDTSHVCVCVRACVCALNNEIRREEMLIISSLSSFQLKGTIILLAKNLFRLISTMITCRILSPLPKVCFRILWCVVLYVPALVWIACISGTLLASQQKAGQEARRRKYSDFEFSPRPLMSEHALS